MKDEDQAPSLAAAHSSENEEATTFMKEPSSPSSRSAGNGDVKETTGSSSSKRRKRRRRRRRRQSKPSPSAASEGDEGKVQNEARQQDSAQAADVFSTRRSGRNLGGEDGYLLGEHGKWPQVESEKKCQQLCIEKGSECHGYVYHSEKMAKPWQSRCAYLDRDTIRFSGLLLPDSWLRMEGVVSATKE